MAEYRTVRMGFWNDPYIESLSPEHKLLYLYLFTCPHTNNLGILEVSANRISFESGLPADAVSSGLERFEADGKLLRDGLKMWLTRFIKHQTTTSEKLILGLRRLVPEIGSQTICSAVCERYPHIFDTPSNAPIPSDTVSIPSGELEVGIGSLKLEGEVNISVGTSVPRETSSPAILTMPGMVADPEQKKRFPPTLEEVAAYIAEKGYSIDPEAFFAHYDSCNWMRGKTKITKWKACVATWKNSASNGSSPQGRFGKRTGEQIVADVCAGCI